MIAAAHIDSLATLQIPALADGIRRALDNAVSKYGVQGTILTHWDSQGATLWAAVSWSLKTPCGDLRGGYSSRDGALMTLAQYPGDFPAGTIAVAVVTVEAIGLDAHNARCAGVGAFLMVEIPESVVQFLG